MYSCSLRYLVWRCTLLHVALDTLVCMVEVDERAEGARETEEIAEESVVEPPVWW